MSIHGEDRARHVPWAQRHGALGRVLGRLGRRVLFDGEAVTLENLHEKGEFLVQTENRMQTITPGTARGRILGGNLSVLTAIIGSPYRARLRRRDSVPRGRR